MRLKWLALLALLAPTAALAQITVTVDAPGVQSTSDPNAITEGFEGFYEEGYSRLDTAVGVMTALPGQQFKIVGADEFGAAGGHGNFFAVGAESGYYSATLTLPGEEEYMGLWLSALDPYNEISLYNNSTLVASYDYTDFLSLVSGNPAYFGNPNADFIGQDPNEAFFYVNFYGNSGTQFNSVVFNNPSLSTGLEIDNISIDANVPGGPPIPVSLPVPLPSAAYGALVLMIAVLLAGMARRFSSLKTEN